MATLNGTFFERIRIISNFSNTLLDQEFVGLFSCTVSSNQNVGEAPVATGDHKPLGFVRGNQETLVTISNYARYNTIPFDFRDVDYDNEGLSFQLLCPSANYGTNDVFADSSQYLLISGAFFSESEQLNFNQIGNPVTMSATFKCRDYKWLRRSV